MQKLQRQNLEDGPAPFTKFGENRQVHDVKDFYTDEFMSAPPQLGAPGKVPDRASITDWSDDDEDCMEVYDPIPVSFTFPLSSPPAADHRDQVHVAPPISAAPPPRPVTKKRRAEGAAPAAPKPKARKKVSGRQPKKAMPKIVA